jgi:hypothetical protein
MGVGAFKILKRCLDAGKNSDGWDAELAGFLTAF